MSAGAPDGAAKGPTATLLVQSPPVAQAPLSPGHYSATQPPEVASTVHGQLGLTIRGRLPPTDYSRVRPRGRRRLAVGLARPWDCHLTRVAPARPPLARLRSFTSHVAAS